MDNKNKINFYSKCNLKFGNKYTYFNDYFDMIKNIKIKCNFHNIIFNIKPKNHIRSSSGSCPKCKNIDMIKRKRNEIDDNYFINKSKNKFKNIFDYSLTKYINKYNKVLLRCIKHDNKFEIVPREHLKQKSGGCKYCSKSIKNIIRANIINKTIDNYFIENKKDFDFDNIDTTLTLNNKQKIKCKKCKKNIKILLKNINNLKCKNCLKIKKLKIINLGKKIEKTIIMRKNFKNDEYIKIIPIKNLNKYYITNYGNLFNKSKNKLKGHKNKQGYIFVRLINNNKTKLYRLHRLVCLTFNGKCHIDKKYVDHINHIRDDNRSCNLRWVNHSENMLNRKKSNITKEKKMLIKKYLENKYDDEIFKIIKNTIYGNFNKYSISNYGRIKNNKTNKIMKPIITDEGYMVKSFNKKLIPIHRLVCNLFNNNYKVGLVVNHIDENKTNNYYKNLEWVSIDKNNKHSKNTSISMLDEKKKIIKTFVSHTEAYKYLNKKYTGNIQKQIKKNKKAYGYYWKINNI